MNVYSALMLQHNVTKYYISNKCCSFELSINQRILKKNKTNCTQLFSTMRIIRNVSWAASQHSQLKTKVMMLKFIPENWNKLDLKIYSKRKYR